MIVKSLGTGKEIENAFMTHFKNKKVFEPQNKEE